MARTIILFALLPIACRGEPPPAPAEPSTPVAAPTAVSSPRSTSAKGGIVEPRKVTSTREESGEVRETHERSDGTIAFEAFYRGERAVRLRALSADGKETWACELLENRAPMCVVRDERGEALPTEALAARNYDARQRLEAARELLSPPEAAGDEHGGHQHSHFKVPPASKEAEASWREKRSKAWAEAEPWFQRVDALQALGLPTVVATGVAKEELSSGFWVVPARAPIAADTAAE